MELFAAIKKRHSYRGEYRPGGVTRANLKRIVQAAIAAPSGCNRQSTTFVIVDDARVKARICEMLGDKTYLRSAPAFIVCVGDPSPAYEAESFILEDCAAAVENMLLAITALGYATVWLDGALRGSTAKALGKLLGVPAKRRAMVLLPIGVPVAKKRPARKLPFTKRAWFNRHG